jgi:hypothetical protein
MTEAEALSLEDNPTLWEGQAAGKFANCAVVGVGGYDRVFLQPKLLKSDPEKDWHWPGRVVRCFVGDYIRFAVFICSDLLNRPGDSSYMTWLHDQLEHKQENLSLGLWLQHNPKPRSDQFSNAIDAVGKMVRTTIVVAGSRMVVGGKRFENYAVSGAFASRLVFPSEFNKFTHRFHYVEQADSQVSRAVLLRYDADAYRVRTVLADALDAFDKVEKGELFDSSWPYIYRNETLIPSSENSHIHDICEPALIAAQTSMPDIAAAIGSVGKQLSGMGTSQFLSFLDLGVVPQVPNGDKPHLAGTKHDGGDLLCRCWRHRVCIDSLTEPEGLVPLAAILQTLGILEAGGCTPKLRHDLTKKTNVDLNIGPSLNSVTVIYPCDFSTEAVQKKVFGDKPNVLEGRVIFVTNTALSRPSVATINAAEAAPKGVIDSAKSSLPTFAPIKASELRQANAAGSLPAYLESLFEVGK